MATVPLLLELPPYVDGQLIAWLGGLAVSCAIGLILMYFRQRRLWRSMYGDKEDDTRPGIRNKQEQSHEQIMAEFDELQTHVDDRFEQLEERMTHRHDELSFAVSRIVQQMDDPPEDLTFHPPWRRDGHNDAENAAEYNGDHRDDSSSYD